MTPDTTIKRTEEPLIEWAGYHWINGYPWGLAHPDKRYVWYADKKEVGIRPDGALVLDINNTPECVYGNPDMLKMFGCGVISSQESFLYGHFHFNYILPKGVHLWPAIWLSGVETWPPEIDIVEGWTGEGYFIKNQPNYRKFIGFNRIHPGVYYGRDENNNPIGKGYGSFGTDDVTYEWYQNTNGRENWCDLIWVKDSITVYYNSYKVMEIKDENILKGLRSKMYVCLDLVAGNDFTEKNYYNYKKSGSPFILTEFRYSKIDD